MDLIALFNEEIKQNNITNKKSIMDYLYKRCAQIFTFDPKIIFGTHKERLELNKQRLDIHNVVNFELNCFTWSYLFKALLKEYDIASEVKLINETEHAYVEVYIDGSTYLCDLTARFEDLVRIKFNFEPIYNIEISNMNSLEKKKLKEEQSLEVFLKYLEINFQNMNLKSEEEYTYIVFEYLKKYINARSYENNIDYITGIQFISKVIVHLNKLIKKPSITHLVNNEENFYAELYTINLKDKTIYYVFSKDESNRYELERASIEKVAKLKSKCLFTQGYVNRRR